MHVHSTVITDGMRAHDHRSDHDAVGDMHTLCLITGRAGSTVFRQGAASNGHFSGILWRFKTVHVPKGAMWKIGISLACAGVVLAVLSVPAARAALPYPTVMPLPAVFQPTRGAAGVTAQLDPPSSWSWRMLNSITPAGGSDVRCGVGEMTVESRLHDAAERLLGRIAAGVSLGDTVGDPKSLEWLRVRLPGVRNFSSPSRMAEIPEATVFGVTLSFSVEQWCVPELFAPRVAALQGIDESYRLTAGVDGAIEVTSATFVGALHAMTTVSQLIVWNGEDFILPNLPITVQDQPRYAWRGLLLDTARHFMPVATIKHIIDGLAEVKMNVLHWHIVDAQSFPLEVPGLAGLTSGAAALDPSLMYLTGDVNELVEYAYERGVRVIPEIDVPGHTAAIGLAYPSIMAKCADYVASTIVRYDSILARMINVVALDPTNEDTYTIVDQILDHVATAFPDPVLHLGGDEVSPGCWNADPRIVAYMAANNMTSASQLQSIFTKRVLHTVKLLGKQAVLWEEAFNSGAVAGTTALIDVWKNASLLPAISAAGHGSVISYGAYLDRQNPAAGTHWMWFDTWTDMYSNMISSEVANTPGVVGGEASSWEENVDSANLDERVFHRTPAVAERLWSPAVATTGVTEARHRMAELRCKMLRRGFRSGPVYPDYCDSTMVNADPQVPQRYYSTYNDGWVAVGVTFIVINALQCCCLAFVQREWLKRRCGRYASCCRCCERACPRCCGNSGRSSELHVPLDSEDPKADEVPPVAS